MIKRIVLLVTISVLSLSAPALAAEPSSGKIEGQVINRTMEGGSVADQDIILNTYLNDAEAGALTTITDDEGQFVFDDLSTEPGYIYEVTLVFQEAEYYSEWLEFDEGETTISVEMTVYDSTTSDEAIKVAMSHTVIYVEQGSLWVEEYVVFINEIDKTYVGSKELTAEGDRETLKFSLPDEIVGLQITLGLMDCCVVSSEEGFSDTMAVLPGNKQVAYSYEVDYNSGRYTFSQKINYPVASFSLMIQGENVEVTVNQLTPQEPLTIEGAQFSHLTGENLAPGDILVIQLSGLPAANSQDLPETNNQQAVIWVVLTLIVLGGGFGLGYLLKKKRVQPVTPKASQDQSRERLLIDLAQLDDDFENGKITEDVHHRLRAARKAQLVELIQGSKGESGNI